MIDRNNYREEDLKNGGFSLIELMITMAIAGIFFAAMTSAFIAQDRGYQVRNEITDMMQGARVAMDMMTREIRQASAFQLAGGSNFQNPASKLAFTAKIDGSVKTVIYDKYTNSDGIVSIGRQTGGSKYPLALYADALSFKLYSNAENLTLAANMSEVKLIEITLTMRTANSDPGYSLNNGYRTYTLTSFVSPRSL